MERNNLNESAENVILSTSNDNIVTQIVEENSLNYSNILLLDGTFFEKDASQSTSEKLVGVCKLCLPKHTEIRGSSKCTSNFVTHLKRKHGSDALNRYHKYMKDKNTQRKRKLFRENSQKKKSKYDQNCFDLDVVKYFVHSLIPLRCIEDPYFREIFNNLNFGSYGMCMMSRRSLVRKINDYFEEQMSNIKKELACINYVSTTIDIWSCRKRSFLGVTVHWINTETLVRLSKAIACERFKGVHSSENIYEKIKEIYSKFNLDHSKIVAAITDNASNFVKAFKVFGIDYNVMDDDFSDSDEDILEQNVTENYVNSLSDQEVHSETLPLEAYLPMHFRCMSHTLSLCATTDAKKLLENENMELGKMHQEVFRKCNKLWKAASYPKSAEIMYNVLGFALNKPGPTRWNSLYDSLQQIYEIREKATVLHKLLNISNPIQEEEFDYIHEYIISTKPIAQALDILQGENSMYFGILLPTLLSLRRKLQKQKLSYFKHCGPLADAYLQSVQMRFKEYFTISSPQSENAAVAAMSHPKFNKFKWKSCLDVTPYFKLNKLFELAVSKEMNQESLNVKRIERTDKNDFFFIESDSDTELENNHPRIKARIIIKSFSADESKALCALNKYPEIKSVFIKYNTPLPSSAPVERLFSYASLTNTPRTNRLSDELFEKRVILKANINYEEKDKN